MSAPTMATPTISVPQPALSVPVIVSGEAGQVHIPTGIKDLATFRRWATSDDFPRRGRFAFLQGVLWADLSREQLYTHNLVKSEVTGVLQPLVKAADTGLLLVDGMLLSNPQADLSTVPDGVFVSYESLDAGRVREVPGSRAGIVELEGSPDMVLEVVSASSVTKDLEALPRLYWLAQMREFWRIDARGETVRFEILRHATDGFAASIEQDGWLRSDVFGKWFRLQQGQDRRGQPRLTLEMRD